MAERREALLIACEEFVDPQYQHLVVAIREARKFAKILQDPEIGQFSVELLENETRDVIAYKLEEFFEKRRPEDVLLLYFAGHGDLDDRRNLYFVAHDTRSKWLRASGIADRYIHETMVLGLSKRQILILDCCFSGAFSKDWISDWNPRSDASVGIKKLSGKGRVTLMASDELGYAFETKLASGEVESVFTSRIIEGMERGDADLDGDGYISVDELYSYVEERIRSEDPSQTPQKSGHVQGQLWLSRTVARPGVIPRDVIDLLNHRYDAARRAGIEVLQQLLFSSPALYPAAVKALKEMRADADADPRVQLFASEVLERIEAEKKHQEQERLDAERRRREEKGQLQTERRETEAEERLEPQRRQKEDKSWRLGGGYGFLTDYGPYPEAQARDRVARLAQTYGIKEFQFYDWFATYSKPTNGSSWPDPFKHERQIDRETIRTYIDEIHQQGGRAWACVQAVGAEEADLADPSAGIYELLDRDRKHYQHSPEVPRFWTYFLNEAWADRMTGIWGLPVKKLGFDGIHWDTLGQKAGDYASEVEGTHAFLRRAEKSLTDLGLSQTLNFVDLAWWDPDLVASGLVAFPYAEVWSVASEKRYYDAMNDPALAGMWGVMAFYPTVDKPKGWSDSEVMLARWAEAPKHRLMYLILGDNESCLVSPYFPDATPLSLSEKAKMAASLPVP